MKKKTNNINSNKIIEKNGQSIKKEHKKARDVCVFAAAEHTFQLLYLMVNHHICVGDRFDIIQKYSFL